MPRTARATRLLALTLLALTVLPARALANDPWPTTAEAVVQDGVANLQVAPEYDWEDGTRGLLGHGYGWVPSGYVGGAYDGGGAFLKVRYAEHNAAGTERIVTAIDLDRDDRADLLAVMNATIENQSGGSTVGGGRVYDVRGQSTATCVRVPTDPARRLINGTDNVHGQEPANNVTVLVMNLAQVAAGSPPPIEPGLLRYAPKIASVVALQQSSDDALTPLAASGLPAAAQVSDPSCTGGGAFAIDLRKATDRYDPAQSPVARVSHDDPAGDVAVSGADLTGVTLERRVVTQTRADDIDDTTNAPRTLQPSDLTIDLHGTDRATVTYLWHGGWSRDDQRSTPNAVIRTEPALDDDAIKVLVYRGLSTSVISAGDTAQCLRTSPLATPTLSVTLPLTSLGGDDHRVSIVLDSLLNSTRGTATGAGIADYRFHTISDPGGDAGSIDHVPFMAGFSQTGTAGATGCVTGGNAGAQVYLDRSFPSVSPPALTLAASPLTPARGTDVTFTVGGDAGTRYCSLTPTFAMTSCAAGTTTVTATDNIDAHATVDTASGAWEAKQVDVRVQNIRPLAAIDLANPSSAAPGTDGTFALIQDAPVSPSLSATVVDADSSTFTYAWTLNGDPAGTNSSTFTPTFSAPGTYTVGLTVTDDSGSATATSVAVTRSIIVVRAPQGELSIDRPTRVIAGQPFDIAAALTHASGDYSALTWQWDLDGDADVDFDPAHTTKTLTAVTIADADPAHLVRVRATDAGGRVADATIALNVRRPNEAPPVAALTVTPASVSSGDTVTFDGAASQLSDPDGALEGPVGQHPADVTFHWDFGDGSAPVTSTTATVTHVFSGSGRVTVTLRVEDRRAAPSSYSDPATHALTVRPGATDANAPTARLARQDAAASDPAYVNRPVTLSAAASTAVAGHAPLQYAFDLDGNGSFETGPAADPVVTFSPTAPGPLMVAVRVTDALDATATATLPLDVAAEPVARPTAVLHGPTEVTLTGVSAAARYDASGSKGNNLDPAVTYRWDLDGDGSFETPTAETPTATANFRTAGAQRVTVRVTDRYGNHADASLTTIVRTPADIAAGCTGSSALRDVLWRSVRLRGCVQTIERPSAGALHLLSGQITLAGLPVRAGNGSRPSTTIGFADCSSGACAQAQRDFNAAGSALTLALDTGDGSLRANQHVTVRAIGASLDLPLYAGILNVTLPAWPQDGITIGVPAEAALFGFPATGTANLKFPAPGEASVTLTVGLPAVVGGFTGEATIRSTATGGIVLDELRVEVGDISIGKLELGKLYFAYNRPDNVWEGGGSLTIPTPRPLTISAELAIQNNRFKRIWAEVSGINQPISQAIYLQALRAGVAVDPLDLTGGITVSAGPAVKGKSVLALDGDVRLRFPSAAANYYLFALTGQLRLADFRIATGFAQFTSNGFFEMGGGIDVDFEIAYLQAMVKGWITANAFNVDGDAEVGLKINGKRYGLLGAHATISTTGFGACGEIPVLNLGGGFGARWGESVDAFWGCDLSPYRAQRPADAPETPVVGASARAARTATRRGRLLLAGASGHALRIPARQEKVLLTVTGKDAPPRVAIVNANGRVLLSTPADGSDVLTTRMLVRSSAASNTTQILWKAPTAGRLWVLRQRGSAAVRGVDMALPAPRRTITTTVSGRGQQRTLRWKLTPALERGQTVQLAEEGGEAGAQLTVTAKSTGSTRFTPQGGRAGRRAITATIITGGLPGEKRVVGHFTAPRPPAPATPRALRLTRTTSAVTARWHAGRGGSAKTRTYEVVVRAGRGSSRKQLLRVRAPRTSVRITGVNPSDKTTVTVRAASATAVTGRARRATIRPGLRASSGPRSKLATTKPRNVRVSRAGRRDLRVRWQLGGAYVRGFSIRVTTPDGTVHLLRTAGHRRQVVFKQIGRGKLRVSVIGRRYEGVVTRKDVVYVDR